MARSNFVKAAQKNIYERGEYVSYESKKGKRAGQTLQKLDKTIPNKKGDKILIAKGESYYWWQFKNSPKSFSKDRPKQSQLTQSGYLSQLYTIQETMDEINADSPEELEETLDSIKADVEALKEECEEKLQNMPESLQSSPTGELIQERIDALENAISEFDSIDCTDYEEPTLEEWITEEGVGEKDEEGNDWEDDNEGFRDWTQSRLDDWLQEKTEEIQNISLEG